MGRFEPSVETLEVCKVRTMNSGYVFHGVLGFDFDVKFSNFFEISKLKVKVSLSGCMKYLYFFQIRAFS